MKKYLSILILALTIYGVAQEKLNFNTKFTQSEDQWVAFPADSLGEHNFGFIYIDEQAGLTFDFQGSFQIDQKGSFTYKKKKIDGKLKYRLEPNNTLVAIIPESHYSELEITKTPDWLHLYKTNENSIERLYKWGYMYNGWGECAKALTFLNKAYEMQPDYKGLRVEIAYSYNCLENYTDAISILKAAVQSEPNDAYIYKELLYAQVHNHQLNDALLTYQKIINEVKDQKYTSENAFNILAEYYSRNDLKSFNAWVEKTKIDKDKLFGPYVEKMKQELKQK